MRKILLCITTMLMSVMSVMAQDFWMEDEEYWQPVIDAIIQVESKGQENAVSPSGKCVGIMQIQKIVVDDCNEYLKSKGISKRFTYNDRLNAQASKEMFLIVQKRYNKSKNIERAICGWNKGYGYKTKPLRYLNAVMKHLNNK